MPVVPSALSPFAQQMEYEAVAHMAGALAAMCCAPPDMVIDRLTDYLWTADEAVLLKKTAALADRSAST